MHLFQNVPNCSIIGWNTFALAPTQDRISSLSCAVLAACVRIKSVWSSTNWSCRIDSYVQSEDSLSPKGWKGTSRALRAIISRLFGFVWNDFKRAFVTDPICWFVAFFTEETSCRWFNKHLLRGSDALESDFFSLAADFNFAIVSLPFHERAQCTDLDQRLYAGGWLISYEDFSLYPVPRRDLRHSVGPYRVPPLLDFKHRRSSKTDPIV